MEFDVTNAKTAAASEAAAAKLGLARFYAETKTATSTVAVINPKDGRMYGMLYNDGVFGDYKKLIDKALKPRGR